jgi:hypothetical protein
MTHFTQVVDERDTLAYVDSSVDGYNTCDYTITYTATWRNFYGTVLPLPTFVTWNNDGSGDDDPAGGVFRFEIQSNNTMDLSGVVLNSSAPTNITVDTRQTYVLQLTASVSSDDMDPPFRKTSEIWLDVNNYCLQDVVTPVNSIDDYVYYINENTEINVWNDHTLGGSPLPRPKVVNWYPRWTQSVSGCPLEQHLYRVYSDGTEQEIIAGTGFEGGALVEYSFSEIPIWQLYSEKTVHVQLFPENFDYVSTYDQSFPDLAANNYHPYTAHLRL